MMGEVRVRLVLGCFVGHSISTAASALYERPRKAWSGC